MSKKMRFSDLLLLFQLKKHKICTKIDFHSMNNYGKSICPSVTFSRTEAMCELFCGLSLY